jgi:hypothetical protein
MKFKNLFKDENNITTPLNMLTITELRKAIDKAFLGKKIDLLIMMNCFYEHI